MDDSVLGIDNDGGIKYNAIDIIQTNKYHSIEI